VVGTSSLRRKALLLKHAPHLQVAFVRGNVETRLKKLDAGQFDALLLATAGLKRLGLQERIAMALPASSFIPAPGQGIMAIEIRKDRSDVLDLLAPLVDHDARLCALTERAVSAHLGLDCSAPFGAYAEISRDVLSLHAFRASMDALSMVDTRLQGSVDEAHLLAYRCSELLKQQQGRF
jgi:hydroxymethylbilane synthase